MARYIDVDKLLEYLEKAAESEDVKYSFIGAGVQATISVIKAFPLEDVAPVIHASFILDKTNLRLLCTNCETEPPSFYTAETVKAFNYCPYCGAKMDEEVDDGEIY